MKKFFLFLSLLSACTCFSQTDSIPVGERIQNYKSSKYDLISKGRRLLLDDFRKGNIEEVKNILDFFDTDINDEDHLGIWPAEYILLCYWTHEYYKIIDPSIYQRISDESPHRYEVYPPNDILYDEIIRKTKESYDSLRIGIEQSVFTPDAKDFMKLLMDRILYDSRSDFISMDTINQEADRFIAAYPHSPMTEIVKKEISYKLELDDWEFGIGFGGGVGFPSGNYTDFFKPKGAFNASMDLFYKRNAFSLVVNIGHAKLREDIPVNDYDVWTRGSRMSLGGFGLCLGYSIFKSNMLRVTPLAGVSFNSAETSESEPPEYLDGFKIGTSTSALLALDVRCRFWNPTKIKSPNHASYVFGDWGMNLRVSYLPSVLNGEGHLYSGDVVFLTLGFHFNIAPVKRKYE